MAIIVIREKGVRDAASLLLFGGLLDLDDVKTCGGYASEIHEGGGEVRIRTHLVGGTAAAYPPSLGHQEPMCRGNESSGF